LTLPAVIRALGLAKAGERELQVDRREELLARRSAIEAATERLDQLIAERGLPDDVVQRFRAKHSDRLRHFERGREQGESQEYRTAPADEIEFALIAAERERINDLYRRGTLKDEVRRRLERELDLREANLANHQHEE
jgi:monovalent cation/hydrogen antiporter